MQSNADIVGPNDQGELDLESPMSVGCNSNSDLYDRELEKYESYAKNCWTIEVVPKYQGSMHQVHTCYFISLVPKFFEKKIKEYPTLIPIDIGHTNIHKIRFKEMDSPAMHVNDVSKNVGDQGHLQSLVKTFTGQATRLWGRHQSQIQSWTTTSSYFVERFGGKNNS